jgi:hypothetical protein
MVRPGKTQGEIEMRKSLKVLTAATALVVVMAGPAALYAHGSEDAAGSTAAPMNQGGMMGQNNMTGEGNMPMGQGGMMNMMNMMNMMGQMTQMMNTHSTFMKSMLEAHDIQQDDAAE